MKVFMIGGTGLLGCEAAKVLLERGHEVTSLALPPVPEGCELPEKMKIVLGNYLEMSDEELAGYLTGCEGFVFAAGVDERVEGPAPIYNLYKKYNIDPVRRLLRIAKQCGVRHVAICGSYFAYFAKILPELDLARWHPYIHSRLDQEETALAFADETFDVAVLELPYIFGTQPGRRPVWVFLVEQILSMKGATLYPQGGSAMVTVHQVGQALAGAIEKNHGGTCYPIGWTNMTWRQLLTIAQRYLGCPEKKIITIPDWMVTLGGKKLIRDQEKRGIQGGLAMDRFTALQCRNLFIDKELGCIPLGVEEDDIEAAIGDSVLLSRDVLEGRKKVCGMRGE